MIHCPARVHKMGSAISPPGAPADDALGAVKQTFDVRAQITHQDDLSQNSVEHVLPG